MTDEWWQRENKQINNILLYVRQQWIYYSAILDMFSNSVKLWKNIIIFIHRKSETAGRKW